MDSPKYNRTPHFPWSPGCTNDDKIAASVDSLLNVQIVITEKIDGSNTSLESGGCFARTHSGPPSHTSFDGLKALHASLKYSIPEGIQLFGEWCFALHSIAYQELPGYFLLFNVRDLEPYDEEKPLWQSWEEVELWAEELGVPTVPVLFKGIVHSEKELKELVESFMIQPSLCGGIREGVVVRVASHFSDEDFSKSVMKCVRANHVQTSDHWKDQEIIKNKLKPS
jgi:hypothetical protein